MKTTVYAAILILPAFAVFARIGETEQQIQARYGKPTKIMTEPDLPGADATRMYKSAGIDIAVNFVNGVSESETYLKTSPKLERAEVEAILQVNAQGKEWKEIPRGHPIYSWNGPRWMLGEIAPNSTLADFNEVEGRLSIFTKAFVDAMRRTNKAGAAASPKGF